MDSPMRALIVISELPIADTAREGVQAAAEALGPYDPVNGRWSAHAEDQEKLLGRATIK